MSKRGITISYSRKIHTLIVEDELQAKEGYEQLFRELEQEHELAPPCFVHSYNDALAELRKPVAYHLLILDLGLPYETRAPAVPGLEPGLSLVREAATREAFPIPTVLVISGRLGNARFTELQDQLHREFWHGCLVNKGVDEQDAIQEAIRKAQRYSDVGIHLMCGGFGSYPTISPREDDLLRRCVLGEDQCLGLQLSWWSADRTHAADGQTPGDVWTKVLIGRFLLDNGMGMSRPTFFKMEPAINAAIVHRDASLMEHKLSHIKVRATIVAGTRSLLVTEKVGDNDCPPISLRDYLQRSPVEVFPQLPGIVKAIAAQLARLGEARATQVSTRELLWRWHNFDNLVATFQQYSLHSEVERLGPTADPLNLYQILSQRTNHLWVERQSPTHGDLNASNVALDEVHGAIQPYIFDASGTSTAVNVRDLANLEVTAILHHSLPAPLSLVGFCAPLFTDGLETPSDETIPGGPPMARNVMKMVMEIRRNAFRVAEPAIYALMVFDCALIQLGGLSYGLSGNKIENPALAALLASYTAFWLHQVAPHVAGMDDREPVVPLQLAAPGEVS